MAGLRCLSGMSLAERGTAILIRASVRERVQTPLGKWLICHIKTKRGGGVQLTCSFRLSHRDYNGLLYLGDLSSTDNGLKTRDLR